MVRFRLTLVKAETPIPVPISLEGTRWLVGRDPDSDIHLSDPLVSRRHALLYLDDGSLWVRDLRPRNPTLVNGEPLTSDRRLAPEDRLRLGSSTAVVSAPDELRAQVVHSDRFDQGTTLTLHKLESELGPGLQVLNRLAASLIPVQSSTDAALMTLDLIRRELPVQRGLAARLGPRETLRVIASFDASDAANSRPVCISRMMLRLVRREQAPICLRASADENGGAACIIAPLFARAAFTGIIYLEHDGSGRQCTPEELGLASSLTRILAARWETLDRLDRLQQENVQLKQGEGKAPAFLGVSALARALREQAEAVGARSCAVTLLGEPGSGKVTLARHIHAHTPESRPGTLRPFVVLDVRPVAGTDPVAELFGTESHQLARQSKLVAAHQGTLCLRHAEHLPAEAQDRLVEALRRAQVETEDGALPLNVRLMITTTLPESELFETGRLTPSFASLVGAVVLEVPPLRRRLEDLPLLAAHFLEQLARETMTRAAIVSPRAMDRLRAYSWPSNVAELGQVLATAGVLARGRNIYPKQLPRKLTGGGKAAADRPLELASLAQVEKRHIEHVLEAVGGNKVMASNVLGIANSTLYQKMKKHHIGG